MTKDIISSVVVSGVPMADNFLSIIEGEIRSKAFDSINTVSTLGGSDRVCWMAVIASNEHVE